MARGGSGTKNDLVKCEYCGEYYSVTYKHCPFCNEDGTGRWDDPTEQEPYEAGDDDEDGRPRENHKGGKRLVNGNQRGGGYNRGPSVGRILLTVFSIVLIVAAVCIVVSIVRTTLGEKTPNTTESAAVTESAGPAESTAPTESAPAESAPAESADPAESAPATSVPGAVGTPTAFTLNRDDFTFDQVGQVFQMKATYTPAGTSGDLTWKSSDPNVASVSWNGVVTAVSSGTVTVTATLDGVGSQECIVRCSFTSGTGTPAATTSTAPSTTTAANTSGLTLNREDFTLSKAGETFRMVVKGSGSAVSWQSSNTAVATVGADGTVTAVAKGTCSVTATVDGVTLKCIVRCSF